MSLADYASAQARVLRAQAEEWERIAAEHRQQRTDWVDQHSSQLGAKRHNAAVRRLLGEGAPGAAKVGRRHLLSPEALDAELRRVSSGAPKKSKTISVADELRAELRMVGGGR